MKIYTSYFYQVRNFKPNMIPLSTAKWDPEWYHQGYNKNKVFLDKNGVINGLRCEAFMPILHEDGHCDGTCLQNNTMVLQHPDSCNFLKYYEEQLAQLNIKQVLDYFQGISNLLHIEDPIIVLLVHEAPTNPCSERRVIQKYFKDNGIEVTELDPEEFV